MPFSIKDYPPEIQKIWYEKCRPVDEIVAQLPSKLTFANGFLGAQPRGFLRALGKRKNFEKIECFAAFYLEPYEFLRFPNVCYRTFYYGPVERMLQDVFKKTIDFLPKQYTQIDRAVLHYAPEYCLCSATVPDAEGYVNLGLNNAADEPYVRECIANPQHKVILEINSYNPWIMGDPQLGDHKIHLSQVAFVYENHEPLFELPTIVPTEKEKSIAELASQYIQDGATIQFGIGGIPNYIATQITNRKNLGIHTEMASDWLVDLSDMGVITNQLKSYRDGVSVFAFAIGTNRLYDWIDHNPKVCILPVNELNSPYIIARCRNFTSINATLMMDFMGQACSESIGYRQYSGTGGQFEFVQGSYLSSNGRSILCLKSATTIKDKLQSNILPSLPPGAAVTVPRFFTDVVVTEYGTAELLHLSKIERVKALVNIAHPQLRAELAEEAKKLNLWEISEGFQNFSQKAIFQSIGIVSSLKKRLSLKYWISRLLK